jgi:hypothetical protein
MIAAPDRQPSFEVVGASGADDEIGHGGSHIGMRSEN